MNIKQKKRICNCKKAQAAVEFLIVVGVAFTMLIPSLLLFSQYSSSSSQTIVANQIDRVGRELVSNIETIYYYGKDSRATIKLSFPERINEVYINPKKVDVCLNEGDGCLTEIVFNVTMNGDYVDFVYFTKVNVTANFTADNTMIDAVKEGVKTFVIKSYGTYINVSRQ
jgi:hypothetical protein